MLRSPHHCRLYLVNFPLSPHSCYEIGLRSLEQCPQEGPVEGVVLDYFEMWLCTMEKIFCYDGSVRGAHEIPDMRDGLNEENKDLANFKFNSIFFFIKCQRVRAALRQRAEILTGALCHTLTPTDRPFIS